TGASGYAVIFLLFLVFLERWNGPAVGLAIVAAYLLSISADLIMVSHPLAPTHSWLSGRDVAPVAGYAVGQLLRPVLVLVIEFGLIGATLAHGRVDAREELAPTAAAIEPPTLRAAPIAMSPSADACLGDS